IALCAMDSSGVSDPAGSYHDTFTNTRIVPQNELSPVAGSVHGVRDELRSSGSMALPTIVPLPVAFIPTPRMLDVVIGSPRWISPLTRETLVGTRPARAICTLPSASWPISQPGL